MIRACVEGMIDAHLIGLITGTFHLLVRPRFKYIAWKIFNIGKIFTGEILMSSHDFGLNSWKLFMSSLSRLLRDVLKKDHALS